MSALEAFEREIEQNTPWYLVKIKYPEPYSNGQVTYSVALASDYKKLVEMISPDLETDVRTMYSENGTYYIVRPSENAAIYALIVKDQNQISAIISELP